MKLKLLHIISFGGLSNYEIRLDDGVNVLHGANESGKTSAAMFIKFVFYGLSAKSPKNGEPSERARFIHRLTGQAAGYILMETDEGAEYRLERAILTSDDGPARERVRIINRATGETLTGQNPGEYFLGVSEEVFMNTCFVGQTALLRPDAGSVGAAVENLLSSADENIDIQKAVRTVDNVRRGICHKNGSGGELGELREKRAALAEEIRQTAGTSAEILRVSTSLNEIRKRIGELEEDKRRCDGIVRALETILLKRRIDSADTTARNIASLRETLADLDASPLGGSFPETVEEAERDIRAYADACSACAKSGPPDVFPDIETDAPEAETENVPASLPGPVAEARRLELSAHNRFTASISLFLAGLLGLGLTLLLYWFNTDTYLLPLLLTLVCVSVGVFFILGNARSSAALTNLLEEWNTETIDELEQLFGEPLPDDTGHPENPENPEETDSGEPDVSSVPAPDDRVPELLKERFDAALAKVDALCAAADIRPQEDILETLRTLRRTAEDIRTDREALNAKLSHLTGKLEALNEQLTGVDRMNAEYEYREALAQPCGKAASELTPEGIKTLMREREFTNSALKSAETRRQDLEERLAALGSPAHNPDEAATALDELDRRIEELSLRHDACELAKAALTQAGEKMRSGILPKIAESASVLLSGATGGTHETLTLDSSFTAGCATSSDVLGTEHLSRGTSDLAYLSLRIALAEEIFKNEMPFMIFDESFAHIDASRIEAIVSLMIEGQYLILTCRNEEALAAEAGGAARLVM